MRFKTVAVAAAFAAGLAGASQAADVNEQGAKDLLGNLTHFLPDGLVKTGFVVVKPASGHYEITYDLQKLFDKLNVSGFDVTGLKPLMALATPQNSGLWNVEGNNAIDVTARSKPGSSPDAEFRYAVASSSFTGVFDPAIHYVRSMDVKGSGITLATRTTDNGVQKNDITIDSINYALSSSSSGEPDKLDLQMIGGLQSFNDKVSSDDATLGEFKIGAIDFRANATKLPLKALNEILRFVSDHKDTKTLSDSESAALKALLRNAMPLVGSLEESVSAKDIAVTTPLGNGGLQQIGYSFKIAGPANAMNADFGMRAEKLTLASGLVPQDYVAFIPDAAELQMHFPT
ncbi:hypothetical protein [Rhizobium leucaenae]|uniref:DUF2125 domain-containing protein n=1 Tax=Rhizobium leucaenae TaxID=29450 RepID=A0A7W6ZP44_9HYPH|nr:hypothetical protein [Rhizobium leucaenae]MBB4565970.1 hypothetical protein [Rhizobium leucaenae]MBB6302403.1 hypothetical protein [Rhizobium leucaenae]